MATIAAALSVALHAAFLIGPLLVPARPLQEVPPPQAIEVDLVEAPKPEEPEPAPEPEQPAPVEEEAAESPAPPEPVAPQDEAPAPDEAGSAGQPEVAEAPEPAAAGPAPERPAEGGRPAPALPETAETAEASPPEAGATPQDQQDQQDALAALPVVPMPIGRPERLGGQPPRDDAAATAEPFELGAYLQRLRTRIARAQRGAPRSIPNPRAVVRLVIGRDGRLIERRIMVSSGNPAADAEALAILARAAPMPPLPPGHTGERLTIDAPLGFVLY